MAVIVQFIIRNYLELVKIKPILNVQLIPSRLAKSSLKAVAYPSECHKFPLQNKGAKPRLSLTISLYLILYYFGREDNEDVFDNTAVGLANQIMENLGWALKDL